MDLALNNLPRLICQQTKPKYRKTDKIFMVIIDHQHAAKTFIRTFTLKFYHCWIFISLKKKKENMIALKNKSSF